MRDKNSSRFNYIRNFNWCIFCNFCGIEFNKIKPRNLKKLARRKKESKKKKRKMEKKEEKRKNNQRRKKKGKKKTKSVTEKGMKRETFMFLASYDSGKDIALFSFFIMFL